MRLFSARRVSARLLFFSILLSMTMILPAVVLAAQQESALQDLLDEALGCAAVYHVEKAEALCDHVLAAAAEPAVQARAHWIKAVAYAHYQLEYRSEKYRDPLAAAKAKVRQLQPGLLADDLARLETMLPFYLPGAPLPQTLLERARRDLLDAESKKAREAKDDDLADPVNVYRLALAYLATANLLPESAKTQREVFFAHAGRLFQKASELRPDSYEFAAYHLTAAGNAGLKAETLKLAEEILARFDGKVASPPLGDRGPFCLYAAAVEMSDRNKAKLLLEARARQSSADPWVHYQIVLSKVNEASSETEQVRLWQDLIRRMETGEIPTRGTSRLALVAALYKLAHFQGREAGAQNDPAQARRCWENALATCDKIAQISPHYAEVHYNRGIILRTLADLSNDPQKAGALRDAARKEFELQLAYNWHGTAVRAARDCLSEMSK